MKKSLQENQIDLEVKLTFLEDTVSEINKVVYKQQKTIDGLQEQLKKAVERIEELEGSSGADLPHVKPPHY